MTDFASTSGQSNFQGGSYLGTSAISSIQMTTPTAGTFNTTLISLYGIKKN